MAPGPGTAAGGVIELVMSREGEDRSSTSTVEDPVQPDKKTAESTDTLTATTAPCMFETSTFEEISSGAQRQAATLTVNYCQSDN